MEIKEIILSSLMGLIESTGIKTSTLIIIGVVIVVILIIVAVILIKKALKILF